MFAAISITTLLFSCELDEEVNPVDRNYTSAQSGDISLGDKLQNPYSLSNMQKAWDNLNKGNSSGKGEGKKTKVRTTHLYLKFIPKNEEELETLRIDPTLNMYSYPLDYEMPEGGGSYRDPEVSADQPTYQYCAVKVDYGFPHDIEYEVLEKLYIPEEDQSNNGRTASVNELINEALRITDNAGEIIKQQRNARSSWRPSGRIKAWDQIVGSTNNYISVFSHWEYYDCDETDPQEINARTIVIKPRCQRAVYTYENRPTPGSHIPVAGVKVRARRWFTTHTGYTDSNGNFSCNGTFERDANYSIQWETGDYDIRDGLVGQAIYNGPKKTGGWNLNISGGKSLRYATIHRAAYRYHSQDIDGLKRPDISVRLKLAYMDSEGTGVNWGNVWQSYLTGGIVPNILIYGKINGSGVYKTEDLIFRTTIHELGHASHIELMNAGLIQFGQVSIIIRESWADAIEWHITDIEYRYRGEADYSDPAKNFYDGESHKQKWEPSDGSDYTPILIDLVDDWNQLAKKGGNRPNDNVTGYTMGGMESQFMKHVYGVHSLGEELRDHKPSGVTDSQINTYLGFY